MHIISDVSYNTVVQSCNLLYECQTTCIRGRLDRLWVNTTVCTDIKNTKIKLDCGMCLSQWSLLLVSEINSAVCIDCVCERERDRVKI